MTNQRSLRFSALRSCVLGLIALVAACGTDDVAVVPSDASTGVDGSPRGTSPFGADAASDPGDAASSEAAAPDHADADLADATHPADAAPPRDAGPDAASGNVCADVGGICMGRAQDCTAARGAVAPSGAPGCVFSDGSGVCCVPPTPRPEGTTCADHGGVCAPIAGCNFVHGSFGTVRCAGPGVVCCLPSAVCGAETQVCCAPGGTASYRPACDRGTWVCTIQGTSLQAPSACP